MSELDDWNMRYIGYIMGSDHLDRLLATLEKRLLPVFEAVDSEALEIKKQAWKELEEDLNVAGHEGNAATANEVAQGYVEEMEAVKQTILNSFAPLLYHAWEQQVLSYFQCEILRAPDAGNTNLLNMKAFHKRMEQEGKFIDRLPCWQKLDELRLVANTVKHAGGTSAESLSSLRPDLFTRFPFWVKRVSRVHQGFSPLSGQHLAVTVEDLRAYVQAAKDFWVQFFRLNGL